MYTQPCKLERSGSLCDNVSDGDEDEEEAAQHEEDEEVVGAGRPEGTALVGSQVVDQTVLLGGKGERESDLQIVSFSSVYIITCFESQNCCAVQVGGWHSLVSM